MSALKDISRKNENKTEQQNIKKGPIVALVTAIIAVMLLVTVFVIIPAAKYSAVNTLYQTGNADVALEKLAKMHGKKAADMFEKMATEEGDRLLEQGDRLNAAILFTKAGRSLEAEQIFDFRSVITGCPYVSAAISQDGRSYYSSSRVGDDVPEGMATVRTMGKFLPNSSGINGIDKFGYIQLHNAGDCGLGLTPEKERELLGLHGIKDIVSSTSDTGAEYVILLMDNGDVSVLSESRAPLTSIGVWQKMTSISTGNKKVFGLDNAGKLHIAYETDCPASARYDISDWPPVRKVTETGKAIIGLTFNGTVVASYAGTDKTYGSELDTLTGITDITSNDDLLILTLETGCPLAIKVPDWLAEETVTDTDTQTDTNAPANADAYFDAIIKKVNSWDGVVRVRFAANGVYGIRYDGKVNYVSCDISYNADTDTYKYRPHDDFAKKVKQWTDTIDVISCGTHAIGVRTDGTLKFIGDGTYLEKSYSSNGGISYTKKEHGVYMDIETWKLW